MPKIILFPGKQYEPEVRDLRLSDMNWPKKVQEIEEGCQEALRKAAQKDYIEVLSELDFEITRNGEISIFAERSLRRQRFLQKVKSSFEEYLHENSEPVPYAPYYLLLFYMEKSNLISSVVIDDDESVYLECETDEIAKVIKLVLAPFSKYPVKDKLFPSTESVLKAMLM